MLQIGVFGAGHLGKFHIGNWKEIEGVHIAGFFDPNDAAAEQVEAQFGIKRFHSEDELIEAADAIDIITPTTQHFYLCEKAIRPVLHVFEEARELVKLVRESKIKLQVGHVERFNPAFLAAQHIQLNPMFIEVHRLAQFNPRGTEVSVIMDLMIHDIDVILSLVKSDIKSISASGVAVLTETPDIANVRIEFDNGCVANLTSSRISMKKMRKMRMFQRDAYIGIDFLDKKTEVIRLTKEKDENLFSFDIETPAGVRTIAIENPMVNDVNAIRRELESFVASIQNNTHPVVNEIDGFRALEVAHQIVQKINHNLISS